MGKTLPLFIYNAHQTVRRKGQDTYSEDMMLVENGMR